MLRYATLVLLLCVLVGCSGKRHPPKTVDVSGTVYLDGEPVEGVDVSFISESFAGYGRTDAQGRYQLVAGAVPGENKVTFSKISEGANTNKLNPEGVLDEEQLKAMGVASKQVGPKQLIPEHYSDPEKSKITFPVPEAGTASADFKLTSGG